jgi:hypothetical protein
MTNIIVIDNKKEFIPIFSSKDEKINTYIISAKTLAKPFFRSWHLNRPSDKKRVDEIRNYLFDTKPEKIDGELFAAEIETEWNSGNIYYEIYDGNHRREAIISGFNELYPNTKIIITIVKVKNDIELLDYFRRINKMIPLSEADLLGDPDIQSSLHKIAKEYCVKYPHLVKTNTRPNRPYFNRDDFVDSLYKIYTTYNLSNTGLLNDALNKMNNYISKTFECLLDENIKTKGKTKTVDGLTITQPMYILAHTHRLYLFLYKDIVIDIEKFI